MSKTIEPVSPLISANSSSDFCRMSDRNVRAQEDIDPVLSVPEFIGIWRSAKCFLFALAYNALAPGFLSLLNLLVTFLCYTLLSDVVPFGWLSVEFKYLSPVDEPCFILLFLKAELYF